jgi:hypothetical protein
MSVIGGQNTPTLNGLAYIIDFNNNYTSGSSTVNPILYLPTASQFTGSVPNLINGQIQFATGSVLRSFQNFPGFNPNTGNLTIMFSGEVKNNAVLFTQDGQIAVVATTSSIGYGVPAGNVGRNFPNTGFDHVTLRFSSASVDCFINGIPVSASGIFPTVPSSSVNTDFKIGGNFISAWTGSLSGSLGQLMVYNRPLSDDEIYSNYLIQARRYGLPEIAKPYTVDSSVYVYSQAAGITDTVTLNALNTFVQGLKSASLWDKMVAIYPFIGTNPSSSRLNLKDVSLNTTQVNYSGSWSTSLSGSRNNNTSSFGVLSNITPSYVHPLINSQSFHMTYLSYDTPVSGGYAMGTLAMATGGNIVVSGSRVYHVYTTTGTSSFTPFSSRLSNVEVMVVAGGGSGGASAGRGGGGGGAGGLVYSSSFAITPGSPLSVIVGNGGVNASGENSVFGSITATGGGRGGSNSNGFNGGSGGGAGSQGFYNSGSGTVGQGNDGGGTDSNAGGGGGGAGSKGLNGVDFSSSPASGSGGSGSFYPQFASLGGSPTGWFAGGGGGGLRDELSVGRLGGPGGGGQGGSQTTTAGNGVANTGGGGGGANWNRTTIGSGGSGIVIVSYSLPNYQYSGSGHSIYISPTEISASSNSDPSAGFTTGGPIGMITVSRTGSANFTISKNKVPTTITARASASINSNIFLNSVNINSTSSLPVQNTVLYTSVGGGLTIPEILTHNTLVSKLQYDLGRGLLLEGFSAEAAYSVRRLSRTSQFAMTVRRDFDDVTFDVGFDASGNLNTGSLLTNMTASGIVTTLPGDYSGLAAAYSLRRVSSSYSGFAIEVRSGSVSQSIGFDAFGNLNTGSLLTFAGSGDAFVKTWYDQSGNNRHATQSVDANQPQIVSSGVIVTENGKPAILIDRDNLRTPYFLTPNFNAGLSILTVYRHISQIGGGFDTDLIYSIGNGLGTQNRTNQLSSAGTAGNPTSYGSIFQLQSIGTSSFTPGLKLFSQFADNISSSFYENSTLINITSSTYLTPTNTPHRIKFGNVEWDDSTTTQANFKIQEFILYTTSSLLLSRGLIEDNINGYYNIFTQSLASGSGYVTRWYDQSGNNNHATQTTSSNQPLIVRSGSLVTQGSRVSLNFDSNFFNLSSRVTLNDFTTFWVARRATGATNRSILLVGDNDNHYAGDYVDGRGTPYFNSPTSGQFISTIIGNTVNVTGTAFHLAYANRRGNQAVGQYNGSTTSNYATVSTSSFFIDNIANYSSIPSYRYSGSVSEIIIHGSDQSSNRTTIESNINSYFNIY